MRLHGADRKLKDRVAEFVACATYCAQYQLVIKLDAAMFIATDWVLNHVCEFGDPDHPLSEEVINVLATCDTTFFGVLLAWFLFDECGIELNRASVISNQIISKRKQTKKLFND